MAAGLHAIGTPGHSPGNKQSLRYKMFQAHQTSIEV